MKASHYGIKNLQRIVPNILEWTKVPNEGYQNASAIYDQVVTQYARYMGHVTKNIAGIKTTPSTIEQKTAVREFVPKTTQQEAVKFLQAQLFTTPTWLLNKDLYVYAGAGDMQTIAKVQNSILNRLISTTTIHKLLQFEAFSPAQAYTASNLFVDLKSGIFSELKTGTPIDIYRRNLQKMYAEQMMGLIKPVEKSAAGSSRVMPGSQLDPSLTDTESIVKGHIKGLIADIRTALPATKDNASRLHLQDLMDRLQRSLNPKA